MAQVDLEQAPSRPAAVTARWRRQWWRIPGLLILTFALVRAANYTGFAVAGRLPLAHVDPDNAWAEITVHHVVQLALALVVIGVFARVTHTAFADFGFNTRQWRPILKWVAVVIAAFAVIECSLRYLWASRGWSTEVSAYPMNHGNVVGHLTFSALCGLSEEPLYRGLVMTMLMIGWARLFPRRGWLAVAAIAGSTLVFMADHVGVYQLTVSIYVEITVLALGVVYGIMFWRTKSLIGPIVTHGLTDVVVVLCGYWIVSLHL